MFSETNKSALRLYGIFSKTTQFSFLLHTAVTSNLEPNLGFQMRGLTANNNTRSSHPRPEGGAYPSWAWVFAPQALSLSTSFLGRATSSMGESFSSEVQGRPSTSLGLGYALSIALASRRILPFDDVNSVLMYNAVPRHLGD